MGWNKLSTFVCVRCGKTCNKSKEIKRQKYCLNCVKPRGRYAENGKHTYTIYSTRKE